MRAAAVGAEAGGGEGDLATEVEVLGPRGPWQGALRDVFGAERAEAEIAGAERLVAAFHGGGGVVRASMPVTTSW